MHEQQPGGRPEHESDHETQRVLRPAVYASSLIDYCRGLRHGVWLHADVPTSDLLAGVGEMLRSSPTARKLGEPSRWWNIRDFAGFGPLRLTSEFTEPQILTTVASGISKHGYGFAAWASHVGAKPEQLSRFEEHYLGEWSSVEDYAVRDVDAWRGPDEQTAELVRRYADHLEASGQLTVVRGRGGGVWLFRPEAPDDQPEPRGGPDE